MTNEIIRDWNALSIDRSNFYSFDNVEKVTMFQEKLLSRGFEYVGGGCCAGVFVDATKKFVVKICQPDADEQISHECYRHIGDNCHSFGNAQDDNNYSNIRKIRREHILMPTHFSDDYFLCIQKYLNNKAKDKIMQYFNRLLLPYRISCWSRETTYADMGPLDNLAWDDEEKKAFIIDLW